jgi:Fe-S cluster biogenesis protein NfuA
MEDPNRTSTETAGERAGEAAGERAGEAAGETAGEADPMPAIDDGERADRLRRLQDLIDLMRPAVQADGGDLVLVGADVETGIVEVQLQGACSSCAISSATLQGGVERILKDRLPWITEVTGGVTEDEDPFESAALGRGGYVPRY